MATLVLTAAGGLGGAIGGAIGSLIGNQIDRALFTPKGAHGARLGSLAVQGSAYGSELPRVFGTMRLAGSVIWATDLVEDRHKSGGKGQAKTTSYSYSSSFAVALSARRVVRVGRIWADGNLLRGAGGDWKSELAAFRLHAGDEDQPVDPLIAAAEGIVKTPAYRGLAYAVFEGLQLADFGNRIPSLSFEVTADLAPVPLAAIAGELSGGTIAGTSGPALIGYAAGGDSVRGAIEGLAQALPVAFADGADGLVLVDEAAATVAIPAADLGGRGDDRRAPVLSIARRSAGTLNEAIAIDYYDPARDYQQGSQSARRGAAGRRTGSIALPAAIDAATARGLAAARLAREWTERETVTLTLPRRWIGCGAGTIVTVEGLPGRWRVARRTIDAAAVTLELAALSAGVASPIAASAGRAVAQSDAAEGPTILAALDLPTLDDMAGDTPIVSIAAAGTQPGWRRATVIGSLDGGASWQTIGRTAPPAVIGTTLGALPDGDAMLIDEAAAIDVQLAHDGMMLTGDDRLGWSAAANLALIGDELVQFGTAEAIGPARYRLRRLLRGRRATEWAMTGHRPGERFVLISADTLLAWPVPASAIGASLRIAATGLGDSVPVIATLDYQGRAVRPPSPLAIGAHVAGDGAVGLAWTRRSRRGWAWLDGGEVPLGEEMERYRVTLGRGAASRVFETMVPALDIAAGTVPGSGPLVVAIEQIGTVGASMPPATLTLQTGG